MQSKSNPPARAGSALELAAIKGVHSLVFLGELGAIGWLLVSGLLNRRDRSVAVAGTLVGAEVAVFLVNRGTCPLTPLAERYGAADGSVSDIFLPDRIARTIPIWASSLLAIAVVLHLRGLRGRLRWSTRGPTSSESPMYPSRPGTRPMSRYGHGPVDRMETLR